MRKIIFFLIIFLIWVILNGKEIQAINHLTNPSQIIVDRSKAEMFVVDGTEIKVFSLKDLKLRKMFGKAGEGPGEILPPVSIRINPEDILVNSKNKVSIFSREFVFLSEKKVVSGKRFSKIKNGFAGQGFKVIGQEGYETFNVFDSELNKGEEIVSRKSPIQRAGKIPVLSAPFIFRTAGEVVYYSFNDRLELGIWHNGKNKLKGIRMDYKNRLFKAEDKEAFEHYFKTNPGTRKNYEMLRQRLQYPDHYPAIRTFLISGEQIYVLTYKKNEHGSTETFIFKTSGNFVKNTWLPLEAMNIFRPYPFFISGSELFQLVETEDENWVLHINKI